MQKWSYEEICDMEFVTVLNSDCYSYDSENKRYTDLRDSETGLKILYSKGIPMKVTGIIKPSEDVTSTMLSADIAYTSNLTNYVIEQTVNSDAVKAQHASPEVEIIGGLPFKGTADTSADYDLSAFNTDIYGEFSSSTYEDDLVKLVCE